MIRILHVEDDDDIRKIVKLSLDLDGGFELLQVENGLDAVQLVTTECFDLFLLDMMMPGLSGTQTLEELRKLENYKVVPAIFMTARVQKTEREELLNSGATAVISKPFDPLTLGDVIRDSLI